MKIAKLVSAVGGAFLALLGALAFPVIFAQVSSYVPQLSAYNPLLIAYTHAQTAPSTIAEMTTEVTTFANSIMPSWLVYVVFALIAAMGIWLIGRAIHSMKRG
jgi:hypothetical protein